MQKQTVIFEENPKWRIYKGKFPRQIGPLSCDRARILYLIFYGSHLPLAKRVEICHINARRQGAVK